MTDAGPPPHPPGGVTVTVETSEDFRSRITVTAPAEIVVKVAKAMHEAIMQEQEKARMRRRFFRSAHFLVFTVAALSVAGMCAHFLNIRKFNLQFLTGMGAWTLGSIVYLYLVIVKDIFNIKDSGGISPPPQPGK